MHWVAWHAVEVAPAAADVDCSAKSANDEKRPRTITAQQKTQPRLSFLMNIKKNQYTVILNNTAFDYLAGLKLSRKSKIRLNTGFASR